MTSAFKKSSNLLASIRRAGRSLGKKLSNHVNFTDYSEELHRAAKKYPDWVDAGMRLSAEHAPRAMSLLAGMSEATNVPLRNLFIEMFEELYFIKQRDKSKIRDTGCTDIIIKDGDNVIIGHTNDENPDSSSKLVQIVVEGLPTVTMILSGYTPSVACNSAGMVFSGNQIDAEDTKPGIPRSILYLEACWSASVEEAESILLNKNRSSSYNNIIACSDGKVINIEASSSASAVVEVDDGVAAHTNHFIWLANKEGRVGKPLTASKARLSRTRDAGKELANYASVDDVLRLLKSHGDGAICRHGDNGSATIFSVVFLPKQGILLYGSGLPCKANHKKYKFHDKR